MPTQVFTTQEEAVLREAGVALAQTVGGVALRQNMTKAEQKAADAALVQLKLDALNAKINNIDTTFDNLMTVELNYLNSQVAFLQGLKTKIENLPE